MNASPTSTRRKDWDSDFFGREIHALDVGGDVTIADVRDAVDALDDRGVWGIEVALPNTSMRTAPALEACGFRLVDSRMTFVTRMTTQDIEPMRLPTGRVRQATPEDLPAVSDLTTRLLVDSDAVYSRFKNPSLFTREETIRYYDAWNELVLRECPELFAVWDVDGRVAGYFDYLRTEPEDRPLPLFKGVLAAVHPDFRGHQAHNALQAWLFPRFGEPAWLLDNTTQLSNMAVLKNHLRARKDFESATLVFFRTRPGATGVPVPGLV